MVFYTSSAIWCHFPRDIYPKNLAQSEFCDWNCGTPVIWYKCQGCAGWSCQGWLPHGIPYVDSSYPGWLWYVTKWICIIHGYANVNAFWADTTFNMLWYMIQWSLSYIFGSFARIESYRAFWIPRWDSPHSAPMRCDSNVLEEWYILCTKSGASGTGMLTRVHLHVFEVPCGGTTKQCISAWRTIRRNWETGCMCYVCSRFTLQSY